MPNRRKILAGLASSMFFPANTHARTTASLRQALDAAAATDPDEALRLLAPFDPHALQPSDRLDLTTARAGLAIDAPSPGPRSAAPDAAPTASPLRPARGRQHVRIKPGSTQTPPRSSPTPKPASSFPACLSIARSTLCGRRSQIPRLIDRSPRSKVSATPRPPLPESDGSTAARTGTLSNCNARSAP